MKKEKCAFYEKVQAKNILEKKHRQGMKGRKQPSGQLESEANHKQLEAGKRTMEQIMNWDLD